MSELPKTLLFLDTELTGLKPASELLELAAILVRGYDLEEVARFHVLVKSMVGISDSSVWDPFVVDMHAKNGLLSDIARSSTRTELGAIYDFGTWLQKLGQPTKGCFFAGSSVQGDVALLQALDAGTKHINWGAFSHKVLDMTSLRTFDTMAGAGLFPAKRPEQTHRAMADCEQDLAQLRAAKLQLTQTVRAAMHDGSLIWVP